MRRRATSQMLAVYMLQVAGARPGRQPARRRPRRRWRCARFPSLLAGATPGVDDRLRADAGRPSSQGLGIGVLVSLLFSLVPLLEVRHVKPSLLLRDEARAAAARLRRRSWSRVVVVGGAGRRSRRGRPARCGSAWSWRRLRRHRRSCCTWPASLLIARDRAAGAIAIVPAAPRGAAPEPARATRRASSCWPSASAASSSSASGRCRQNLLREFSVQRAAGRARHVPARHPARSGRRRVAALIAAHQAPGAPAPRADSGAARAGRRRRRAARSTSRASRTCAAAARWRASTRSPIATRSRRTRRIVAGQLLGPTAVGRAARCRSSRASTSASSINVGDTMRFDVLGRVDRGARDQRPGRRVARQPRRRVHVRVPARACSSRRRTPSSASLRGPAGRRPRAPAAGGLVGGSRTCR